jgi:putative phage-type endonuclease
MSAAQGTEAWHGERRGRLTGSRIGAALGVSPFTSRKQLIKDMVDEHFGIRRDISNAPPIKYGLKHEAEALEALELVAGVSILQCGFFPLEDWGGASPDGLTDRYVVEVKCPYKFRNATDAEFLPLKEQPHYWHQVQMEMHAAKREWALFFQWSPKGMKLEYIARDPNWLDDVRAQAYTVLEEVDRAIDAAESTQGIIPAEQELADLLDQKQAMQDRINELRDELWSLNQADYQGELVTVQKIARQGSIDYAKAVRKYAPADADLEEFRRAGSESLTVRRRKPTEEQ